MAATGAVTNRTRCVQIPPGFWMITSVVADRRWWERLNVFGKFRHIGIHRQNIGHGRHLGSVGRHRVVLHVQADPGLSLREAHDLGGRVRSRIVKAVPSVVDVLVHMEPLEG